MLLKAFVALIVTTTLWMTTPAAASEIDFSKAVVVGSGSKTVVEFTDPDCPFCRKASTYFDARPEIKRYVFFYPLPRHPKAKEKVQHILSLPENERALAYHDAMSGKFDNIQVLHVTPKGIKLQEEQMEIVRKNKVNATPTFMINGRVIEGLDQKRVEEALGK
ncbi:MAG TPA: thioredoxin domain-containing protein [Desulfuromonadaceae bacterium]|jgi:thiol:disulfide interchange protein DsbC